MTNIMKTIEKDSMTKAGHMIKAEVKIGTIRTSEVGTTLEKACRFLILFVLYDSN